MHQHVAMFRRSRHGIIGSHTPSFNVRPVSFDDIRITKLPIGVDALLFSPSILTPFDFLIGPPAIVEYLGSWCDVTFHKCLDLFGGSLSDDLIPSLPGGGIDYTNQPNLTNIFGLHE